jgi:hypothetical protein
MAEAQGYTEEQISGAPNWTLLGEKMADGADPTTVAWEEGEAPIQEDEEPEDEEPEDDGGPKVGSVWLYKPMDPATKKRAAKAVEVEVMEVNAEKGTCVVKDTARPKTKYSVKFDLLEPVEG